MVVQTTSASIQKLTSFRQDSIHLLINKFRVRKEAKSMQNISALNPTVLRLKGQLLNMRVMLIGKESYLLN